MRFWRGDSRASRGHIGAFEAACQTIPSCRLSVRYDEIAVEAYDWKTESGTAALLADLDQETVETSREKICRSWHVAMETGMKAVLACLPDGMTVTERQIGEKLAEFYQDASNPERQAIVAAMIHRKDLRIRSQPEMN